MDRVKVKKRLEAVGKFGNNLLKYGTLVVLVFTFTIGYFECESLMRGCIWILEVLKEHMLAVVVVSMLFMILPTAILNFLGLADEY